MIDKSEWTISKDNNKTTAQSINNQDWHMSKDQSEENKFKPEESFSSKIPRDIGIGLANLGHSELNAPHDIVKGIENRFQDFGKSLNKSFPIPESIKKQLAPTPDFESFRLSNKIPYQQEYDFAKMLGQTGQPTWADTAVQKGVEYAPELLMAGNVLRNILPHLTQRGASRTLNRAQNLARERNIGQLDVNPELIEDARQYLPNNLVYRRNLDAAHHGDYDNLFTLQSNVGQIAGPQSRSWFSPRERMIGRAGLQARNALIEDMHTQLQSLGHQDISDLLRQGQNEYRRYMRFRPYRNAIALAGATAGADYLMPKNPLTNLVKKLAIMASQ